METTAIATTDQATLVDPHAVTTPFVNTLSADTLEGKLATANALNTAVSLKDYEDTPLHIVDIIQTPGIRKARDKSQVDTPCDNTYLISADGTAYFTQSEGIARSVRNLLAIFPDFNKPEGLTVVVTASVMANGNTIKSLSVLNQ